MRGVQRPVFKYFFNIFISNIFWGVVFEVFKKQWEGSSVQYSNMQQQELPSWRMMDRSPFITIYSLSLFMRSKNCQKMLQFCHTFGCPHISPTPSSSSPKDEKLFLQRLDDGRIPLYHHIQAYIHYSWGHIKSSSHFPIRTNGMNHLLTERKSIIACQVTNLHFPRQWQCLFVEGGSSDSNLGPRKGMGGRSHWSLNENKHKITEKAGFSLSAFQRF